MTRDEFNDKICELHIIRKNALREMGYVTAARTISIFPYQKGALLNILVHDTYCYNTSYSYRLPCGKKYKGTVESVHLLPSGKSCSVMFSIPIPAHHPQRIYTYPINTNKFEIIEHGT